MGRAKGKAQRIRKPRQPQRIGKDSKLTPADENRSEIVQCPSLTLSWHKHGCILCHGTGLIRAIP